MSSVPRGLVPAGLAVAAVLIALDPGGSTAAPADDPPPLVAYVDVAAERGATIVVPVDTTVPPRPAPDVGTEVIALANSHRAAAGLAPLVTHPSLQAAALAHSLDQAAMDRMTHRGSDGSDAGTRIERAGYSPRRWGENVAMGYRTAASVTDGWMGSPGHRANILDGSFTLIGVALAQSADGTPYWTMVLAA